MRSKITTFLKIGVSVGLIFYAFSRVPLALVWNQLASARLGFCLLALAFYLLAVAINAAKWQVLLHAQQVFIPFPALLQFQFIGFFFNNILPANVGGDVMRGYSLARYTDRTADAAVSVVVDRIVGLMAYMSTAAVGAFLAVALAGHSELRGVEWVAIGAFLVLSCMLALLLSRRLRSIISTLFGWRLLAPLAPIWEHLSDAFNSYRFRYDALAKAFAIGLVGILATTLVNWLLSLSMGGGMTLMQILIFNPLIALALTIPISIGGIGVSQSAYTFFYGLAGVPAGHALAVSILMYAIQVVASLPGGVLWLRIRRGTDDQQPTYQPTR
jgi:glycosyltransferase 2 family protein